MEDKGTKFDQGKTRLELIPPFAEELLGKALTYGANEYGADNWAKGIKFRRLIGAAKRHIAAIERGEDFDDGPKGSGMMHVGHALAELAFLAEMYRIHPEMDDRRIEVLQHHRVGLDIDDVLADFCGAYCTAFSLPIPTSWCFDRNFKKHYAEICNHKEFWLNMGEKSKPTDMHFEPVCYISSRDCDDKWTTEWLDNHDFPRVPVIHVGIGQSKVEVAKEYNIDIFVDDCFQNVRDLNNAGIFTYMFDAPHNRRYDVGHRRIKNLTELFSTRINKKEL